jgi:hypothetical protein
MRTIDRTRAPVLQEAPAAQLPALAEREAILSRARNLVANQSASVAQRRAVGARAVVESTRAAVSTQLASLSRKEGLAERVLPPGQRVRLQMFCSGAGIAYIGIGLEHDGNVQLVGAESPNAGNGRGNAGSLLQAYNYIGALREWNCPVCRRAQAGTEAFGCVCACFSDVLHCGGRAGGNVHCACGAFGEPDFRRVPSLSVRGHASARAPVNRLRPGRPALLLSGPPQEPKPLLPRCLR